MNNKTISDVDEVLEQLKITQTATHIDNIDITWDMNNQLVITLEMLVLLLTKTSCLPLVPDFTEPTLVDKLGINNEQAKMIQNLNSELIYIHGLLQKTIITEYVTSSVCKEIIDNTIDSLPQTDISNLLDFIRNYHKTKSEGIQTGGQINKFLKIYIFIFFLSCINSTANLNLALIDPSKKRYSSGIIKYSPNEFTDELVMQSRMTSGPISSSGIVAAYDKEIDKEVNTMYGKLMQFLQIAQRKNGSEVLQEFATEFNQRSNNFSKEVESNCLELMVKSNQYGIFSEFTDIDTIEETENKIAELNNEVEREINNIKEEVTQDITGIAVSTAAAAYSDPVSTTVTIGTFIGRLGINMYNYLTVTNSIVKEKKQLLQQQKTVVQQAETIAPITREEKIQFEHKIYEFSRVYCSLGYNLKIVTDENTIKVDGDKVPYISMINLIVTLNDNLQLQITKLLTSSDKDKADTRLTISALMSIQQRLGVLKKITEMLSYIVNRSAKIKIMKTNDYPDPNSIEDVKSFFNSQLSELNSLLVRLNAIFPEQEEKIEEDIKILEERKRLTEKAIDIKILTEDIKDIQQNETAIIMQRKTDRFIRGGINVFNATGAILQSWSDMGLNMTEGIKDNFSKYTLALTDLVGAGPLALVDGILKFLNKVLFKFMTNPSFYVVIACGLLFLEFTIGGIKGRIRIFLNASKQIIVTIVVGPLVFVYKLLKTPFGYIWSKIDTLHLDRENYQKFLKQQEEGEIYEPDKKYGGRKRKTHKNSKNKKNKTRKIRHKKKHNTRYKRRRLTRRR